MSTERLAANAIRALSMDAVEKARSGHPGMPMGMADIADVLWREFLNHNPNNPQWTNRDRFVLSNGHGCMLLYSLLHLTGYDLSINELKNFRQLHSKTPGHPEFGDTPGVEATTGPLGQGLAMAVGMAIAEKHLSAQFNEDALDIVNPRTYVFAGDGCLMEGISHEACSLAGTLGLHKLIVFYDDNQISIDGPVSGWFSDNTPARFRAYHWNVIENVDGHDRDAIKNAIIAAQKEQHKPTIICCKTKIGFGAPTLAGSEKTHGAPLGEAEIQATKKALHWPYAPFEIPDDVYQLWDAKKTGAEKEKNWNALFSNYQKKYPAKAAEFLRRVTSTLPENFNAASTAFIEQTRAIDKPAATRQLSQQCIEFYETLLPEMFGGSADLSGSNNTKSNHAVNFSAENPAGNYLHYGVREFGMSAIMNGLALHKGIIPFGGTFLTFSDYAKNAVRMSAIMKQKVIYVYSHDSIGLGEDGPTHQPIEHIAALRMIPGLQVWRPCDFTETAVAWREALTHEGPSCILLTRQTIASQSHNDSSLIARGGYILFEPNKKPEIILIATGSEVQLAIDVAKQLAEKNKYVRVVSMPCCERFKAQDKKYRDAVLPENNKCIAIEAGAPDYWYQFANEVIGIESFGASAPAKDLWKAFGFTVDAVLKRCALIGDA